MNGACQTAQVLPVRVNSKAAGGWVPAFRRDDEEIPADRNFDPAPLRSRGLLLGHQRQENLGP